MDKEIVPGRRSGAVVLPASKSYAHRHLISAALSENPSRVICDGISKDISATIECLRALGAVITAEDSVINVTPISRSDMCSYDAPCAKIIHLNCHESGSTLRFLIPIAGALGANVIFHMEGRLAERPLNNLTDVLSQKGMTFEKKDNELHCSGKLTAGRFTIPGNVSSQYITGLLFSLPLLDADSTLEVTGHLESEDYVVMTETVIKAAGIVLDRNRNIYSVKGKQKYNTVSEIVVEKDWSNAAFFMCMGALSDGGILLSGLSRSSVQGDKRIFDILAFMGADISEDDKGVFVKRGMLRGIELDASGVPDMVPTLAALASVSEGRTVIYNAARLRMKESDRIKSTVSMINSLGGSAEETEDGMIIEGQPFLKGGTVDAMNDHRIAMATAAVSCACRSNVLVKGCECVEKSYPRFWADFDLLEVER